MPKKPSKEVDVDRLCAAMQRARLSLRRYREERVHMVREYVGPHWSDEGSDHKIPINLLSFYVQVVGRNLIAKNPRVMLSVFDHALKPTVKAMESWCNKEIERMNLQQTMRRIVVDALFSIGICKVALATPADSAKMAWGARAGQPFAERVDLDDFVFDTHARDFEECGFIGHRFRAPIDAVKDSKVYGPLRKQLEPQLDALYNMEGDERVGVLGRGIYDSGSEEFEDMVDLWEVYLPRHRLIYTLADDQLTGAHTLSGGGRGEALRVQGWLGPDKGPYHVLAYGIVPGNAMPKAPLQDLLDLHDSVNILYRKAIRMSERVKENTFVQGAMEDAERLKEASDGEIIPVQRPEALKQVVTGGSVVQPIMGTAMALKALFSEMAGNLELLAGAGPQSKTATQDKMLNANAGAGMADMQDQTIDFAASILKALCWYWKHDPFQVQKSLHSLPGMPGLGITRQVMPAQRKAIPFEEMDIQVDPYSMQHATPQSRLEAVNQVVQQIVVPLMPLLQQSGIAFDINAYLQKVAQYINLPDLGEIITIQAPPDPTTGGGGEGGGPGMPGQTERTYNRVSMPGRTKQGNEQQMIASMMGHNLGGNPESPQNGAASQ